MPSSGPILLDLLELAVVPILLDLLGLALDLRGSATTHDHFTSNTSSKKEEECEERSIRKNIIKIQLSLDKSRRKMKGVWVFVFGILTLALAAAWEEAATTQVAE